MTSSSAFEIDNITSGMTKFEVEQNLAARGWTLKPIAIAGMYNVNFDKQTISTIGFCNGKLFSHSSEIVGGTSEFLTLLERELNSRGKGDYEIQTGGGDKKEITNLSFNWDTSDSYFSLSLMTGESFQQVTRDIRVSERCSI
jgi:hypothetical protein